MRLSRRHRYLQRPLFLLVVICWLLWLPAAAWTPSPALSVLLVSAWVAEGAYISWLWRATRRKESLLLEAQL